MNKHILALVILMMAFCYGQNDPEEKTPIPELQSIIMGGDTLETGALFFQYRQDLELMKAQLDSLRSVVKVYEKKQNIPLIDENLLKLIKVPEFKNRIVLQNGTIVSGTIIQENEDELVLQTQIGRLVLNREFVVKIDENLPLAAKIEIVGSPSIESYPDREIITGKVINSGEIKADFVRVIANLWSETTELVARDSAFVNGQEFVYNTGVITDTMLEPGKKAEFKIVMKNKSNRGGEYHTFDIRWVK